MVTAPIFYKFINAERKKKNMYIYELCERSGISESGYRGLRKYMNCALTSADRMCNALGVYYTLGYGDKGDNVKLPTNEPFVDFVERIIEDNGFTYTAVANAAGIPLCTLSQWLRGVNGIRLINASKICEGLGVGYTLGYDCNY